MEKIKIKASNKRKKNFISLPDFQQHLKNHDRFTVTSTRIKSLQPYSSDVIENKMNGELNKALISWTQGVLVVQENKFMTVLIDRTHLQTYYYKGNLKHYLNRPVEVEVATIQNLKNHVYVVLTRRPILTDIYNKLVEENKPFTAKVVHYTEWGAYLKYKDLRLSLRNTEVSPNSQIAVRDVLRIGDEISVVPFRHIDDKVVLNVRTEQAYQFVNKDYWKDLYQGNVVEGVIRKWTPSTCYVRVAPGIDAICNYPNNVELDNGMKVKFRITQANKENNKLRGKIQSIINTYSEELAVHADKHTQFTKAELEEIKEQEN